MKAGWNGKVPGAAERKLVALAREPGLPNSGEKQPGRQVAFITPAAWLGT